MGNLDTYVEKWKKRLLDFGMKNRLINYRETKRSNIKIVAPDFEELYRRIVTNEEKLEFSYLVDDEANGTSTLWGSSTYNGDIETNRSIQEQQKTLRNLR